MYEYICIYVYIHMNAINITIYLFNQILLSLSFKNIGILCLLENFKH
jgi:hypothetical protein